MSGVVAPAAAYYDFNSLIQAPIVSAVAPLRGPTSGGTLVTVQGSRFASDATVLLLERNVTGSLTGGSSECDWRTAAQGDQVTSCNDTVVRWVRVCPMPHATATTNPPSPVRCFVQLVACLLASTLPGVSRHRSPARGTPLMWSWSSIASPLLVWRADGCFTTLWYSASRRWKPGRHTQYQTPPWSWRGSTLGWYRAG